MPETTKAAYQAKRKCEEIGGETFPKINRIMFKIFENIYRERLDLELATWPDFLQKIKRATDLQDFCKREIISILKHADLNIIAEP